MLNRVVLVGRLTKDPELKYTPNGVAVANFTLAVNRPFKNAQGENEADFINIVVWRKPAENVANYLKKGSLCGVDGRLQTRSYENNQGQRVYVTEVMAESVQFLEPKKDQSGETGGFRHNASNGGQQSNGGATRGQRGTFNDDPFADDGTPIDISDDDLPF
jgi:single-strand DNA-binding protein